MALARALGDPERQVAAAAVLAEQRMLNGHLRAAEEALALVEAPEAHPEVCLAHAELAMLQGRHVDVDRWAARAEALAGTLPHPLDRMAVARAWSQRASIAERDGNVGSARAAYERALAALAGTPYGAAQVATALNGLGECARAAGALDEAVERYRASLAIRRHPMVELNLALAELERGRVEAAAAIVGSTRSTIPVVALTTDLLRAACAAETRDAATFDAALRPFARGWPPVLAQVDPAQLATRAARAAARIRGWQERAVTVGRVALALWRALGRAREAEAEGRALRRLADAGASQPVGPFRLERPIARGGFGEVWRARHPDTGRSVAVKVFGAGAARHASLDRELRAMAALDHPNVIRLLDFGRIERAAAVMAPTLPEGAPWLATELADGTLEPLLGRIPWPEVLRILVALLDALAHAHARGLLHLDVKPANVLMVGGTPRLADFGLAWAIGSGDPTTAGSPAYMAPEQYTGGERGPWTDLYALGCVAAALVSGAPPFGGTTLEAMRAAHLGARPRIVPAVPVPAAFERWVARLLAKQVEDRFHRAADAARALVALGPAVGEGIAGRREADPDLPTVVLPPPSAADALLDDDGERVAIPPPRVPAVWDRPQPPPTTLADAGLALFGLRAHPFVGRRAERSRLWAALREGVDRREVVIVALRGPRGVGASALAAWLCERAHEVGAAEIVAVRPSAAEPPIAVLRRGLARALGAAPDDPLLAAALAGDRALGPGERDQALARAIERAAERRPLVIWADDPAAERAVLGPIERVRAAPVLALLTGAEAPDPPRARVHRLDPLPEPDQRALIGALLPFAPATLDRLVATTGGDPRFAVQLVTDLVASDRLALSPEGAALAHGVALPATPAELWRQRLGRELVRLSGAARRALEVAALLEPVVDLRIWEAACGRAGVPFAVEGRDALLAARLARATAEGFAFEDATVRELLLDGVDRVPLHAACAAAVIALGGDPAAAGAHLEAAGRPAEAVPLVWQAAVARIERGDYVEGLALAERLLALTDPLDGDAADQACFRGCQLAGAASMQLGRSDAAIRSLRRGIARAERVGATQAAARLTVELASVGRSAGVDLGLADALRRVARDRDPLARNRAHALVELAYAARARGDRAEAEATLAEALALVPELGDLPIAAIVVLEHGRMLVLDGRHAEAVAVLEAGRARAAAALNRAIGALDLDTALVALGRLDEAERVLLEAEETLVVGGHHLAPLATLGRAVARWARDRWEDGDRLADEALRRAPVTPRVAAAADLAALVRAAADPEALSPALARVAGAAWADALAGPCLALAARRARAHGRDDLARRIAAVRPS